MFCYWSTGQAEYMLLSTLSFNTQHLSLVSINQLRFPFHVWFREQNNLTPCWKRNKAIQMIKASMFACQIILTLEWLFRVRTASFLSGSWQTWHCSFQKPSVANLKSYNSPDIFWLWIYALYAQWMTRLAVKYNISGSFTFQDLQTICRISPLDDGKYNITCV